MSSLSGAAPSVERRTSVLVVASDAATTHMLATILTEQGCEFQCASGNNEALTTALKHHFDLVVTGASTSGREDVELLRKLRTAKPHSRLIILTDENTPHDVISAMRERAFSYFSRPFAPEVLREMIRIALASPCWDDGIEILSATPAWIRLLTRGDKDTADRLLQFVTEVIDLPEGEKSDVAFAFRELLLNAIRHGTRMDPNKFVEVAYVRAKHMISCRVTDPGEGFSFSDLHHAAISNPIDNPIRHSMFRDAAGLPPGGYGILLVQHLVDELIYGERGNDVLLIKYLSPAASTIALNPLG